MSNYITSTGDIIGIGVKISTIAEKMDYLDLQGDTPLDIRVLTLNKLLDAVSDLYDHLTDIHKALESAVEEGAE